MRVGDARVHTLPTRRAIQMRGVTDQRDTPLRKPRSATSMRAKKAHPSDRERAGSQQRFHPWGQ